MNENIEQTIEDALDDLDRRLEALATLRANVKAAKGEVGRLRRKHPEEMAAAEKAREKPKKVKAEGAEEDDEE